MDKEQILRKAAKIKDTESRFNFRNHTLVTTRQALKAMDEVENEALKISSNPMLPADATNWKEKYEKCIAVIKRFDAGIIGMYDL